MPRPSRNIDELLLQTGRELLAESGSRAFSIRHLTQRAVRYFAALNTRAGFDSRGCECRGAMGSGRSATGRTGHPR